jgi:uncharacterized protein (TIGR04141 family)
MSLLKEGLTREDALRDPDAVTAHRVPVIYPDAPSLFVATNPPHPPGWRRYLVDHVPDPLEDLVAASCSAVLLIDAGDRLFAVTFGQGRHLLDPEAFEHDFGLKVVLNRVAPDQLKSVDAKTIDETTVHTRRDLSRDSSFSAFGLDISRDLLRAVTGTPEDDTLAHRLTGADALGLHTRQQIPELPALAERLLEAYQSEDYKANFDFIDHLRPEKRAGRIRELEAVLIEALATRQIDDVHLAAPETLDWLDVDGFRFSSLDGAQESNNDPHISAYLDSRRGEDLDIATLKGDRLIAIRASDGLTMDDWPIYRCLVYQVELGDRLYVLSAGDWFRVDLAYRDRVYADVGALKVLTGLPDADPDTDEDAYNIKAADHIRGLCLDRHFVHGPARDKMEICDILTRDGGLIHVKPRGSSSTLSHLFAQGVNSAERLLLDQEFRTKARAVAKKVDAGFPDVLPSRRPSPEDHEISFVVITRSDRPTPLTLPFFSVVTLRRAAQTLDAFGFRVSVAAVRESS